MYGILCFCLLSGFQPTSSDGVTGIDQAYLALLESKWDTSRDNSPLIQFDACFRSIGADEISRLVLHAESGIAVRAAWERFNRAENGDSRRALCYQCFGVIEGRMRTNIPTWWKRRILQSHALLQRRQFKIGGASTITTNKYSKEIQMIVPSTIDVALKGDAIVFTKGVETREVVAHEFHKLRETSKLTSACTVAFAPNHCLVAMYSNFAVPFQLASFSRSGRTLEWSNWVCAGGWLAREGFDWHEIELVLINDSILVFGSDSRCQYLESFLLGDGRAQFRFCNLGVQ